MRCCALVRDASDALIEGDVSCISLVYLPGAQLCSDCAFYVLFNVCGVFSGFCMLCRKEDCVCV